VGVGKVIVGLVLLAVATGLVCGVLYIFEFMHAVLGDTGFSIVLLAGPAILLAYLAGHGFLENRMATK